MPDLTDSITRRSDSAKADFVFARSDIGLKRTANQDRWVTFDSPWGKFLVLADGMGGHLGGGRAADLVVERFPAYLNDLPPQTNLSVALQTAIQRTNRDVYEEGHGEKSEVHGMGSTLVLAVLSGDNLVVAHCGDSRAYLSRAGRLTRLTEDHTVATRMLRAGILSPAQALHHPDASLLTRSVGVAPEIELTIADPQPLQRGDLIVLCSDGLSGHVPDAAIERAMASHAPPDKLSDALIKLALASGGSDNITVVIARHGDPVPGDWFTLVRSPFRSTGVRLTKKSLLGVFAVAALTIIGFGIRFDLAHQKTAAVKPETQDRQVPVPSAKTPQNIVRPDKPARVVVQLLADREQVSDRIFRGAIRAVTTKEDIHYLGSVTPPGKPRNATYLLLRRKANKPITILFDLQFCSIDQVDAVARQMREATGLIPERLSFHATPSEVGELSKQLANVGILVILNAGPGISPP